MVERKTITDLYVRICRDMKFGGDYDRAAKLTAGVLKIHPLEVLFAVGFDNMLTIADGKHPLVAK